jgi:diguanylate cyclase (GGDEF)-like protein
MADTPVPAPWGPNTLVAPVPTGGVRKRAVMTVLGGSETGRVLELGAGKSVTLGRRASCTHRIDDASVSGVHARVLSLSDLFMISDEGSTNGTFVNGLRLAEPMKLADGDRVHLGRVLVRFSLVDEAEEEALKRMYDAALRDPLTGLFNRKHLDERIDAEIAFAKRHTGHQLSIVIFDVDHFKKVNDTHGHLTGDAVLKAVAAEVLRTVRTDDCVARYGGEEFVIVARDVGGPEAFAMADRLRETIAEGVVSFGDKQIRVTASAGVASLAECEKQDKASLLGKADQRLYAAKEAGRNRVVGP